MQDYGSGWLRLYRFVPQDDQVVVTAITFDPRTEELCEGVSLVPERTAHQFEFEFSLTRRQLAAPTLDGAKLAPPRAPFSIQMRD